MKQQSILKSTLCLLMALVCNVSWAQTSYFKMGTSTTSLSDGNYVLVAMSEKGTGPVIYDPNAGEAKHYRYEAGKTLAAGDVVSSKYVWTIDETTADGAQHIIVTNYDDDTKAFPADVSHNQNFTGSGVASLLTEVKTINGTDYIALSRDIVVDGNTLKGYVHANAPGGNPCLSYWESYGDNGTCVKFTFYPVVVAEEDELAFTFTDLAGNTYTGTYQGFAGATRPTIAGASYTLSNEVWNDTHFTATITFPFPVSSARVTNATMISSFKEGDGNNVARFKWYATGDPELNDVKFVRGAEVTKENLKSYSWAIYPSLENGAFVFSIKNVAANKYIYTEASYANQQGSHGDAVVTLEATETPTKFFLSTDEKNRFYYVSNNVNQYLSLNSVSDGSGSLGVYAKEHAGTTNSFYDATIVLASKDDFVNGEIYTFVTARGWMGAKEGNNNVISTAMASHGLTGSYSDPMFQWTVYKSNNGNYFLYNLGKQQFMGVQSSSNASIPFAAQPAGKKLTFKNNGQTTGYPIMFSTDNAGVANHSTSYGDGLITWTGGWNTLDDGGSNHKVSYVGALTADQLKTIADLVEAYDKCLYVKAEVEGSWEDNPNTHYGRVRATSSTGAITTKLNTDMDVVSIDYDGLNETTIDFTRDYRGFEFQGYSFGGVDLGKSFTITEELASSITAENPLVAKFRATEDATLWYDDDPFSYRIPAIGKTSTGRLIAVSDYRYSLDDIGRYNYGTANPGIDLVIRMSDDNGKTWGETKTIAKCSGVRGANDCAYGDAAIAVVGQKVLVMGAAGDVMFGNGSATAHNRTVRIFSEDNGATWTNPQDISETLFIGENATIQNGYTAFFGSGKLAVDEDYNNTGVARIYGAMLIKKEGYGNAIYVIYTDDFGVTWSILGGSQTPVTTNDEPKVEILPSGQILLSVRRSGGRQFNVFTYSDKATNAGSWNSNVNGCGNGGSNTCNGEIYLVDAKKADGSAVKLLLQSQPKGGGGLYDRRDVTIWYKEITDAAYTSSEIAGNWIQGMQVSTQLSAYSTMVLQNDGKIAFFFEEAPCYGDDYAKGYSMVYTPLTIENITKGHYFSPATDLSATQTISVVLTDAQGNEYRDQVESGLTGVAETLTTRYPFITLGDNANLSMENGVYVYTNTVTLPFKVSNEETTVWHNIYFPSNTGSGYPIYFSAAAAGDVNVGKVTENAVYGNSSYNTADYADKISWAVYSVNGGFTFKFKNKLTEKFIQAASVATGDAQNVKFVDEADATAFELVPDAASYNGDYALKAVIGGTTGYLCSTSAGYANVTHYNGNGHQGAWVKFTETPDFETLIAEVNATLDLIGTGLGQYTASEANAAAAAAAKEAMQNSATVKLNTLNSYKNLTNGATLNLPVAGQYFRVAYDYGNAGKLYMQSTASSVKGLEFTAATDAASIWVYYDGALYSYTAGQCLRETGDDRGLQAVGGKTTATFVASTRAKGKYNLQCGSWVHANTGSGKYYTDHCGGNNCAQHDLILEEVTELPVNISAMGYGTLYAPVALEIPEHVEAYTGVLSSENGEEVLDLTKITTGVIPAGTGVVLYRDKDSYGTATAATAHNFVITTTTETVANNAFHGSVATMARTSVQGEAYTLQEDTGSSIGVAFKPSADNIASGEAYLVMPSQHQAQVLRIRFAGNQGDTTEIEPSTLNAQPSTEVYDLQGRRVATPTKGLYIVNGRKVVIK